MPNATVLDNYYDKILATFPEDLQHIRRQYNISFAEAKDYTFTQIKTMLIHQLEKQDKLKASYEE
jgi:hypothetical protein